MFDVSASAIASASDASPVLVEMPATSKESALTAVVSDSSLVAVSVAGASSHWILALMSTGLMAKSDKKESF